MRQNAREPYGHGQCTIDNGAGERCKLPSGHDGKHTWAEGKA
jgi:hypothetical protein